MEIVYDNENSGDLSVCIHCRKAIAPDKSFCDVCKILWRERQQRTKGKFMKAKSNCNYALGMLEQIEF